MKTFQPIAGNKRIEIVDALRGFALLGVLLANISYSTDTAVASNSDSILTFLYHLLIDKKFITIFSMLFGFGFYIQMTRAEQKGIKFKSYFLKRMVLLFIIGLIHCFLIWNGDIIMSYAFGGAFLLIIRKWSLKRLLILALIFNVFFTGAIFIGNSALGWASYSYDFALWDQMSTTITYVEYLKINAIVAPWSNFMSDMPLTLCFTFGNMLIGLILGKTKYFLSPSNLKRLVNWFIILGLTVGLLASYTYYQVISGKLELDIPQLWIPFAIVIGMLLQSMAYISLFLKLFRSNEGKKLLSWFKYVGKTALTNYIMQSVFYITVIFHCTGLFKLYGTITMGETLLLALVLFVLQSIMSYVWLNNFKQGPIEYIWRKLSYQSKQHRHEAN